MNRRIFLRGLGGAVVAAPFLSSVAERQSRGQTSSKPKQLIVMFTHYGCDTVKFFPAKSNGALTASDLANSLTPLAPYVGKILIPRGIRAMNEWTSANNGKTGRGQGNDPHLNACGSYFTCQPVTPNGNDPFSFNMDTKFNAKPIGSSMDHVIAQQLSATGTPFFMRVGNSGGTSGETPASNISYLKTDPAAGAAANAYPGFGTPAMAFSALTGLFGAGSPTPATYAAIRGKKVTDCVRDDLATFERLDMSAEDKRKVAAWKALLNDVTPTMTALCTPDLPNRLGATADNIALASSSPGSGKDWLTAKVTSDLDGADMYSVMAVLAAACNYNPAIVLKYPPTYVFTGLGINVETATLSHRVSDASLVGTCLPNAMQMIQTIDTYYATKFAKLIGMLDGIQNGDGSTLLDGTATVWFNEMSDGLAQNLNNLPIIQAGSCGGYFKTGWTINVDTVNTGGATLTQGNSESQCGPSTTGMTNGISQSTGTDASIANAPINKYLYNLMNAVGVRADDTGFPAKGGTGPVTHFGYSDKTTDFCGGFGAVAGAGIYSPGEYSAFRAS